MGLEFILTKGKSSAIAEVVKKIFDPEESLGQQDLNSMTPEELLEFYESGNSIPYLNPAIIMEINKILNEVSESDIHTKYDAKELNDNEIYPGVWHNDNSPDQAFNKRQLVEDLAELKTIIRQATEDRDYILVFTG